MPARRRSSTSAPTAALAARRAGILLFSGEMDAGSHWARLVAAEKDIDGAVVEWVRAGTAHEDWMLLSPAQVLPTLADREVVLYPARLIVEYLDERYPHPPLLPAEPIARARVRMAIHQLETTLYPLVEEGLASDSAAARTARQMLREQVLAASDLFPARGFFMGAEYGLVDSAWAPLLWRLPALGIGLDSLAGMRGYAERLFGRPAFRRSLSGAERALSA